MMTTRNRIKTILTLTAVAMAILGLMAAPANAKVTSIDFDKDNTVQSGEPIHNAGMTLPGQVGDWYKLSTGTSGSSPTITTPEGTLTVNTTGADYRVYNTGSRVLREDFFWLSGAEYGPIQWELTGLTPNGTYNIICYGRYDPAYNGYRGADMSIVGYNGGNPVAQETTAVPEGDWNFPGVVADGTGKIQGTFAWNGNAHAEFCAIQFEEIMPDTDGDGMSDEFELEYTSPPSPTALNPGDDLEPDGLTNLEEYNFGTDPTNPDSDGDTLTDGDEVAGAGSRPPTNPAKADTDGDTLSDLAETNTGTYVSSSDTGTDPTLTDTDADALEDQVETNTGNFVSESDTGTDPTNPDSDSDNAGDWYEIVATFTDPANPADKPNIPYPLPDPDGSTGNSNPVKVYILSGQSNMVGFGTVGGVYPGTLEYMTTQENKFPNLVDGAGAWTARNDVMYRGVISAGGDVPLRPGFGANSGVFGPELGFGHVMGYHHDEPVIVLKSSIGNRSLSWDCLPPGSPRFTDGGTTYAGYGDSPNSWPTSGGPSPYAWYAGKQYDDYFLDESDMGPAMAWTVATDYPAGFQVRHNGVLYVIKSAHTSSAASEPGVGAESSTYWNVYSIFNVVDILDNFASEYPEYATQGFEIAGFVWWQGHKDQGEPHASRYELNMVNFINELREYYEDRYPANTSPDAPFVLATIAFDGWDLAEPGLSVANGQLAVSGETGNYPEFAGNVKTIEARGYWRDSSVSPTGTGYHYNHNAETYMLTGDALGRAMIELLATGSAAYSVDAGDDMITWSGEPVELDATVQDGVTVVSYAWSANPAAGVVFSNDAIEDPSVTITKATGNPSPVKLTLTVNDGVNPPVANTMTIDVYDDSCLAAKAAGPVEIDATDIDANCITNFGDFAVMAITWLDDYTLTGPVAK